MSGLMQRKAEVPALLSCGIHFSLKEEYVWSHLLGSEGQGLRAEFFLFTMEIGTRERETI